MNGADSISCYGVWTYDTGRGSTGADERDYSFELEFFGEIDPEVCIRDLYLHHIPFI